MLDNFPYVILITFALFIQIEASSFEAKMSEELGMCTSNMAEVWQSATDLTTKYNLFKKRKR